MQSAQVHPEAERVAEEDSHPPAATRMAGAVSPFAAARAMERRMSTRRIALAALLGFLLASPARAGDATALPEEGTDLDSTLAALRRKLDVWAKVIVRYSGTPSEPLALVEEERLERRAAELVVANRRALEDGTTGAERALRFLVEKHADSKNLPAHVLRLGDFYADLARDYVTEHELPLGFDEEEFVHRADRALETYRKVATWDGA